MKTITLFDICQENYIPTVRYSANPETIARWGKANTIAVHDGYAYVEPNLKEHWVDFDGETFIHSDIPMDDIDWQIFHLAIILHNEFELKRYRLYFYNNQALCGNIESLVSGID